jgi:hypothetical protein
LPLRRDQPAANAVGRGPESVELGLEQPIGMIERFGPLDRVDQHQHVAQRDQSLSVRKAKENPLRGSVDSKALIGAMAEPALNGPRIVAGIRMV